MPTVTLPVVALVYKWYTTVVLLTFGVISSVGRGGLPLLDEGDLAGELEAAPGTTLLRS